MSMVVRRVSIAVAWCVLGGLGMAACGSSTSGTEAQRPLTTEPTSTGLDPQPTSSSPPPTSGASAVSVSLIRTGGLKPVPLERTFSASKPPPSGYTSSDVRAVLQAADAFESADVSLTPVPDNPCCDQYSFAVTVLRDDGSSATYRTMDGQRQPRSFDTLLRELS